VSGRSCEIASRRRPLNQPAKTGITIRCGIGPDNVQGRIKSDARRPARFYHPISKIVPFRIRDHSRSSNSILHHATSSLPAPHHLVEAPPHRAPRRLGSLESGRAPPGAYNTCYRVSNNNCYSWQKKNLHKIFKTVNCTYFGLFYSQY
jgi:hypothetical protein